MADRDSPAYDDMSEHSSGDECDEGSSEQQPADEESLPYPFLGRPYLTNSILNTLDLTLVNSAMGLIKKLRFNCIQLTVAEKKEHHSLSRILFGSHAVAFSKTAG